jgi:hypothetical protein
MKAPSITSPKKQIPSSKGKDVYLHILRWPSDTIVLPAIDRKMVSHELLTGGKATVKQIDGRLEISVPKGQRDPLDTIIKISFDKSVTDIKPLIPATTGK